MKNVKIKFVGFWEGWSNEDNFIINALRQVCIPQISDEPDILFASCFSDEYMEYDCVRVFYTGENICPDFNEFDYAIGFEKMEYGDRYLRYPLYLIDELYGKDYELMLNKHIDTSVKSKTDFCSFVVSNGSNLADDFRAGFFRELSKYKKVNSGGRYLNNIGEPNGVADKLHFQMKHKFSIAFENTSHKGYLTEKLIQSFAAGTVPIYWGDPTATEIFNEKSFINCHMYNSIDAVIKRVIEIDNDERIYSDMLSERALVCVDHKRNFDEKLLCFLNHIVEQNAEEAFRTNRIRYGREYFDRKKKMAEAYRNSNRVLNKVVDKLYEIRESIFKK